MSAETVNEAFRGHVTRVGFDLSLGRTHIAALVHINESLLANHYLDVRETGSLRSVYRLTIPGLHGLGDRGLVIHTPPPDGWYAKHRRSFPIRRVWKITKAGRLVIALLKESGIYQEYAAALPLTDRHLKAVNE